MKLENKCILLISPEFWNHLFVSKHHYATHLGAIGNKVFFLNPPSRAISCHPTDFTNVFSVHYCGFIKGLRFMPGFLQRWLIRLKFEEIQTLCGVKFDLVWSFDNSVFFDFSALPNKVYCISHIVDLNQDFNTRQAASSADCCFGVIPHIVDRLKLYNSKSFLIPHATQKIPERLDFHQLIGENSIKTLYIGNLSMPFIDWLLIIELVKAFQNIDFIMMGSGHPPDDIVIQLKKYSNIYFTDPVSSNQLLHFLNSADVLLMVYTKEYFNQYASPHKMMEYLASGKVIVATWLEEYQLLSHENLIQMAENQHDFLARFGEVVQDLNDWNSLQKSTARRAFALENTYDLSIEKIEDILSKN